MNEIAFCTGGFMPLFYLKQKEPTMNITTIAREYCLPAIEKRRRFWSSDILTGIQTFVCMVIHLLA